MEGTFARIDFDVLVEVLLVIIVLAFLIERALALVFEHRLYIKWFDEFGLKEPISVAVSFAVVRLWKFEAVSMILQAEEPSLLGYLLTAAIIAGGSKASIKLFGDVLGIRSTAENERLEKKKEKKKKEEDEKKMPAGATPSAGAVS